LDAADVRRSLGVSTHVVTRRRPRHLPQDMRRGDVFGENCPCHRILVIQGTYIIPQIARLKSSSAWPPLLPHSSKPLTSEPLTGSTSSLHPPVWAPAWSPTCRSHRRCRHPIKRKFGHGYPKSSTPPHVIYHASPAFVASLLLI
jgi:hypothetical protein